MLRQSALAKSSGSQTAIAAVQPSARLRQQSAKPKGGKAVSRLARTSQSPASSEEASGPSGSDEEEDSQDGSSEEESEGDGDDSSEEGRQADNVQRRQLAVDSPGRRLSNQQADDSDEYPDDSAEMQSQGRLSPEVEAASLQQQQRQAGISGVTSAAFTRNDSSGQLMQQQHTEHMHVAVRARPIPTGASASCWTVDPQAATITLDASATAAKRKQALYGSNALRSSNGNGLESGQSRGFLGTAPSTPGSGFWDSSAPMGTSLGYKFDQVLDESAETAAVYSTCIQSLVHSALEGVNGTVLAYGELTVPSQEPESALQFALSQSAITLCRVPSTLHEPGAQEP